jgi:hypothetical protein
MVEGKKAVEQAKGKKKARAASNSDAQIGGEPASGLSDYLKTFELHYGYKNILNFALEILKNMKL